MNHTVMTTCPGDSSSENISDCSVEAGSQDWAYLKSSNTCARDIFIAWIRISERAPHVPLNPLLSIDHFFIFSSFLK